MMSLYTTADWTRAYEKSIAAPATLDGDDFAILEQIGGAQQVRAAIARRDAALPAQPKGLTLPPSFIKGFVDEVVTYVKKSLSPRDDRITALEHRLTQLEAKPYVKFCGVYERDRTYTAGAAVVHKSALWICKSETFGEPGQDFVGWQLALKRGDAR